VHLLCYFVGWIYNISGVYVLPKYIPLRGWCRYTKIFGCWPNIKWSGCIGVVFSIESNNFLLVCFAALQKIILWCVENPPCSSLGRARSVFARPYSCCVGTISKHCGVYNPRAGDNIYLARWDVAAVCSPRLDYLTMCVFSSTIGGPVWFNSLLGVLRPTIGYIPRLCHRDNLGLTPLVDQMAPPIKLSGLFRRCGPLWIDNSFNIKRS